MATNRYSSDPRIRFDQQLGAASAVSKIRAGIQRGTVPISGTVIATGADRLDTLAGKIYGDARYWWVLAASSNIGWGLQIPPGTVINIVDLNDVDLAMVT